MAKDYYGDAGPSANAPDTEDNAEPNKGDESMENTALVPRDVLHDGIKVGDVCKFKVVHLYEDEAEIQYIKSDKEDKKEDSDSEDEHPVDRFARENNEM